MSSNISSRDAILLALHTRAHGLTIHEVNARRVQYGRNSIPSAKKSIIKAFFRQFNDIMVYILLIAAAVSILVPYLQEGVFHTEEMIDAGVILAIVLINAVLGFVQEWRAENAIALLKSLSAPQVKVRRSGTVSIIPAEDLVPGDIMLLEAGDRVSADARVIASSQLEADEASLTGESLPVQKVVEETIAHNDSFSRGMVYAGTLITRGSGECAVIAIGIHTEIGKITQMVAETEVPETPLTIELKKTGGRIGIIVLALCAIIFAIGLMRGIGVNELFFTVVSLAVAAVPEGLPAIVTLCLAFGVRRMTEKHALVRKLDAIETLGSVSIICADKTGTITQNKMTVVEAWQPEGSSYERLIQSALSCNHAVLPDIGDPTEVALLQYNLRNIERLSIAEEEVPFSSEEKYMVTSHERTEGKVWYMKGAPESVARFIDKSASEQMLAKAQQFSEQGMRVLAFAERTALSEEKYVLLGLLVMIDPPRAGVKHAIERALHAGIRTVMITGDHPLTARAIALQVGIHTERVIIGEELETMDEEDLLHALKTVSVFARVRPVHKVRILEAFQSQGRIVAMSGDGVNDAPALKRANVGIGMGKNGTDIAREASSIVLTDDNYTSIVDAIAEGRRIYDNICKFVLFLLRSNIGEVCIIAASIFLGLPLPLLPIQILWINLVTDSFPALALSVEPAERALMSRPPRKVGVGMFEGEWGLLLLAGVLNAGLVLILFTLALKQFNNDLALARSVAMMTTILFQMFLALSSRVRRGWFFQALHKNPWLLAAITVALGLQGLFFVTPLGAMFSVSSIPLLLAEEIIGFTILGFLFFEGIKLWCIGEKR